MGQITIVQFSVVPTVCFDTAVTQVRETFPYRVWPPVGDNFVGEDAASRTIRVAVWDDLVSEQDRWIEDQAQTLSLSSKQVYAQCCEKWTELFCSLCQRPVCVDHRLEGKEIVCLHCRGYDVI